MVRKIWAGALLLAFAGSAAAEDWTGKLVMLKRDDYRYNGKPGDNIPDLERHLLVNRFMPVTVDHGSRVDIAGVGIPLNKADIVAIEDALEYWNGQIKQYPNYAIFYARRAATYHQLGAEPWSKTNFTVKPKEFDSADEDYSTAIRLDSDNAAWPMLRAALRLQRSESKLALNDLTEVIRLQPKWGGGYSGRGYLRLFQLKDYDNAIEDFTKVIELAPDCAIFYHYRACALSEKSMFDKAIQDWTKAIELTRNNSAHSIECYSNRGAAWYKLKKYDSAFADFAEADKLAPKDVRTMQNLAWCYATCPEDQYRNGKKAIDYAKALVANSDVSAYREILAAAYAEMGDFDNAVNEQVKAIEMQKSDKALDKAVLATAERRLALFKSKKPYREE